MMTPEQAAYSNAGSNMTAHFVPKTVQEIRELCKTNPNHPVAVDLLRAIASFTDDTVCNVLPVSMEAVTQNRTVQVSWRMAEVENPTTHQKECRKVKEISLGEVIE